MPEDGLIDTAIGQTVALGPLRRDRAAGVLRSAPERASWPAERSTGGRAVSA